MSDDIANDEFHAQQLMQYFLTELRFRNYSQHMDNHPPVRRDHCDGSYNFQMVNEMGFNFITCLQEEPGANIVVMAANAYAASAEIYGLPR
ncbi:NAD-glutamate dehydrogenase [Vibrio chagasii]|nr:NAD-glutamate dehydrogenase [Vibrio chagasii]